MRSMLDRVSRGLTHTHHLCVCLLVCLLRACASCGVQTQLGSMPAALDEAQQAQSREASRLASQRVVRHLTVCLYLQSRHELPEEGKLSCSS